MEAVGLELEPRQLPPVLQGRRRLAPVARFPSIRNVAALDGLEAALACQALLAPTATPGIHNAYNHRLDGFGWVQKWWVGLYLGFEKLYKLGKNLYIA